ncbi:MAG: tRNA lysidine(34) synthetase TilS, partial [Gemmatimonadota bacterium]|nr:tRNA lysidine(34) synthetase TilS [Gemmatimonadota bacterium]
WVLAVSGGRDSMALLAACAEWRRADIAAVATFDHGTGPAAVRAAAHVEMEAMRRRLPVVRGKTAGAGDEASWRTARWAFLDGWAEEFRARVVTAHTRDDQAETVFMRILRDAGARGLAAMRAASPVLRPFLDLSRAEVAAFVAARDVAWVDDPSNARLDHLRNRVRLEMLPAFERAQPGFTDWLVAVGERAAEVREAVSAVVDGIVGGGNGGGDTAIVPAARLAGFTPAELEVLWPEIAARAGVTLDWRGLERLVRETAHLRPGAAIPLAGGPSVSRTVSTFVVRNRGP